MQFFIFDHSNDTGRLTPRRPVSHKLLEVMGVEPMSEERSKQAGYMFSLMFDLAPRTANRRALQETSTG